MWRIEQVWESFISEKVTSQELLLVVIEKGAPRTRVFRTLRSRRNAVLLYDSTNRGSIDLKADLSELPSTLE